MKSLLYFFLSVSCLSVFTNYSMEKKSPFLFRLGSDADSECLLKIINEEAVDDSNNIVIVPEKFRRNKVKQELQEQRLFVAVESNSGEIIGFKKLFVINNAKEQRDILQHEIRCLGNPSESHATISLGGLTVNVEKPVEYADLSNDICVYNGADFTRKEYRGKGVNKNLTDFAWIIATQEIGEKISRSNPQNLIMVYGLVRDNSGTELCGGRTKSIVSSFVLFVKQNYATQDYASNVVNISRYSAYKPTFDPKSEVLQPLGDDQSIAGFGYVLLYSLISKKS